MSLLSDQGAIPRFKLIVIYGTGKTNHLALLKHRGGGWWDVRCMGQARRCRAGTCEHTARLAMKGKGRPRRVRQVPREEADRA